MTRKFIPIDLLSAEQVSEVYELIGAPDPQGTSYNRKVHSLKSRCGHYSTRKQIVEALQIIGFKQAEVPVTVVRGEREWQDVSFT